jgi:predicted DNA-binding transcriptional regulator AlpA
MDADRLIRKSELMRMLGITSPTTVDAWERELDGFPKRRRVSGAVVAWLESEVLDWIRSRPVDGGRVPVAALEARGVGAGR